MEDVGEVWFKSKFSPTFVMLCKTGKHVAIMSHSFSGKMSPESFAVLNDVGSKRLDRRVVDWGLVLHGDTSKVGIDF